MNKLAVVLAASVAILSVACGGKQGAPASGGGGAGGGGGGGEGAAVCAQFAEQLKGFGAIEAGDPANHEGREGDWSCRSTVKTEGGYTCHLAVYATAEAAAESNARLANSFWVVPQSDGKTSYNKAGAKAVLWCGGGQAVPEVETAGRAVADAS